MSELGELVKKELVVDERTAQTEIVESAKRVLKIDTSGKTVIIADRANLSTRDLLLLLLIGRWLSHTAGLQATESMTLNELTGFSGAVQKVVRARLAELSKAQLVARTGRGSYKVSYVAVSDVLRQIAKKAGRNE